jgi:putative transposase
MGHARQSSFFKSNKFQFQHGGELRRKRAGRGKRPLSTKDSLHVVFKMNREAHRQGLRNYKSYTLPMQVIDRYAKRFFIKVVQVSIQGNHIHMLIRAHKRSLFHHFFRVVAGQIAQGLSRCVTDPPAQGLARGVTDTPKPPQKRIKFWKYRPFSRVVKSWTAEKTVRNYIQLNEKEARGEVPYSKERLKGLTPEQIQELWE